MRTASRKLPAPTGITMNSWKSILLSACLPPLMILAIGTGRRVVCAPPRYLYRGSPRYSAAALATAMDTPKMALAPSLALFSVPSSSIMVRSISTCSRASRPQISPATAVLTFSTALSTPLPR